MDLKQQKDGRFVVAHGEEGTQYEYRSVTGRMPGAVGVPDGQK